MQGRISLGRLDGKVALITGSDSGINQVAANLFAQEGAKIMVFDINDAGGEATVEMIRKASGKAAYVHCDTIKVGQLDCMVKAMVENFF
jgi:NAD(P)-dependent dehydrogenase (short-subunit alcohol dehydrogenase family)